MLSRTRTIIYEETVSNSILQTFRETGAYLKGHFRLTSGLHSSEYLQSALVLQHPDLAERLGRSLAESMPKGQVVVSPALGGLIIGHEVARAMGARFMFTERDPAGQNDPAPGFSLDPRRDRRGGRGRGHHRRQHPRGDRAAASGRSPGGRRGLHHRPQRRDASTWGFPAWLWRLWMRSPGLRRNARCASRVFRWRSPAPARPLNAPDPHHRQLRRHRLSRLAGSARAVATIQRALEDVLSEIEGDVVHVDGSGRTDAGVHALAQVAAFTLTNPIPLPNLKKAMNRLLPRDIRVLETAEAHAELSSALRRHRQDLRISHSARRDLPAVRSPLRLSLSLSAG